MFFGIFALNQTVHTVNEDKFKKTSFNTVDSLKIGLSTLGCAFFTTAALICYPSVTGKLPESLDFLAYSLYPAFNCIDPLYKRLFPNNYKTQPDAVIASAGILSGILAYGLGYYTYKKISGLKNKDLHVDSKSIK